MPKDLLKEHCLLSCAELGGPPYEGPSTSVCENVSLSGYSIVSKHCIEFNQHT